MSVPAQSMIGTVVLLAAIVAVVALVRTLRRHWRRAANLKRFPKCPLCGTIITATDNTFCDECICPALRKEPSGQSRQFGNWQD